MTITFPKTDKDIARINYLKNQYNKNIAPVVEKESQNLKLIYPDLSLEKSKASFLT